MFSGCHSARKDIDDKRTMIQFMVEMLQGLKIATSWHLYLIMVAFNKSHPDLTGILVTYTSQEEAKHLNKKVSQKKKTMLFQISSGDFFPGSQPTGVFALPTQTSCTIFVRQNSLKMTFATFASSLITPKNGWHLMTRNNPTPQFLQLQKSHRSCHQNLHPTCFDSSFRQICLPRCPRLTALFKG